MQVIGRLDGLRRASFPSPAHPFLDHSRELLHKLSRSDSLSRSTTSAVVACLKYAYHLSNDSNLQEINEEGKTELQSLINSLERVITSDLQEEDEKESESEEVISLNHDTHIHLLDELEPPDDASSDAFLVLAREALISLDSAEGLVISKRKRDAARSFHASSILLKVLESLFGIPSSLKHKMSYADWRAHQNSHLFENLVTEHLVDRKKLRDSYKIDGDGKLGSGSYGTVMKVIHKTTKQVFACKALPVKRLTPHFLNKVHAEIEIMKEIDHPNIARLREVFFSQRTVYLVMDLCEGGELFQLLTNTPSTRFCSRITSSTGRGFKEGVVRNMLVDMLSALKFIHEHGIVHRDLKLENFLFEERPTSMETMGLRLIDFGLSKYFEQDECIRNVVGSSYYMAPEVLDKNYNHKCDMWSLGVITYMLLSGMPPFRGRSDKEICKQVRTAVIDFPPFAFEHISNQAVDFMERLMERDVDARMDATQALQHPFVHEVEIEESPPTDLSQDEYFLEGDEKQDVSSENGGLPDPPVSSSQAIKRSSTLSQRESVAIGGSLKEFCKFSALKRLMLEVVAFSCTPDEIHELRDSFVKIDTDRSGTISLGELQVAMSESGSLSPQEVEEMFKEMDVSGIEEVNYTEFLAATMYQRIRIDEDRLHHAFETFDKDGNGFIELEEIMEVVGADMGEEDIRNLIAECDENGDGKIDYEEFASQYRGHQEFKELKPFKKFVDAVKRVSLHLNVVKRMSASMSSSDPSKNEEQTQPAPTTVKEEEDGQKTEES